MNIKQAFKDGYGLFTDIVSAELGSAFTAMHISQYLDNISEEIENLTDAMNAYQGNNNPSLNGYLAEVWHKATLNIDAAAKRTGEHADMPVSNKLGSVDVETSWGEDYSLKYCNTGKASALSQAHSLEFAYNRYISRIEEGNPIPTREEYLISNGLDPKTDMSLSLYVGQSRLCPSDQIQDAIAALKDKLRQLSTPEREHLKAPYQETLDRLVDHIGSPNGAKSCPLTQAESKALQECSKQGKFDPARFDITLANKADMLFVCGKALQAGAEAAIISALIKATPALVSAIKNAIKEGYISPEDFGWFKDDLKDGAFDGFMRGAFTAAITTSCLLGYCGESLKEAAKDQLFPGLVATMVVLSIETFKESLRCAHGDISKQTLAHNLEKKAFIALAAYGVGTVTQTLLPSAPVIGFLIGSIAGSIVGGVLFEAKEKLFMSICVVHGLSFFGLVEQDYTLPDNVKKKLGYELFQHEGFEFDSFEQETMHYTSMYYEPFEYEKLDIVILKRGVIGIRKVGYLQ